MARWSSRIRSNGYLPAVSILEEAAARFYKASLLGPVLVYNEDETQRVMKRRRKDSVVQKIWDHNVAKTKLAGLMDGI